MTTGGNPDPVDERCHVGSETWDGTTCPRCGDTFENLPPHLRACDE